MKIAVCWGVYVSIKILMNIKFEVFTVRQFSTSLSLPGHHDFAMKYDSINYVSTWSL